jgi:hypothetical protein
MSETKHTPGPWSLLQVAATGEVFVVTHPETQPFTGHLIAARTTCPDWPANAHLIAAAPDLLASCKELAADLVKHARYGLNDAETAMLQRAEAAIAKADPTNPRSTQCSERN